MFKPFAILIKTNTIREVGNNVQHNNIKFYQLIIRGLASGGGGGGRSQCSTVKLPKCSEENLKKTKCATEKKAKTESPFKSMWYNPECCAEQCVDVLPRFDELYYTISDKAKRKYAQTWVECPELKIVPKKICSFDQAQTPPLQKRDKKDKPKTACGGTNACGKKEHGCVRIDSPGCKRKARIPPNCTKSREVSQCKKICAPYPSFSECSRPEANKSRIVECQCLSNVAMCDAWEYLRRMARINS